MRLRPPKLQELMMKMREVCLFSIGAILVLMPIFAVSREDLPLPPCCPRSPGVLDESPGPPPSLPGQSLLVVSDSFLQSLAMTRSMFIDRVSRGIFPGAVDGLTVSSEAVVNQVATQPAAGRLTPGGDGLVAIRETRVYRRPLLAIAPEELDKLDSLIVTNGGLSITIRFVSGSPMGFDFIDLSR
jgi:hypothetical protein